MHKTWSPERGNHMRSSRELCAGEDVMRVPPLVVCLDPTHLPHRCYTCFAQLEFEMGDERVLKRFESGGASGRFRYSARGNPEENGSNHGVLRFSCEGPCKSGIHFCSTKCVELGLPTHQLSGECHLLSLIRIKERMSEKGFLEGEEDANIHIQRFLQNYLDCDLCSDSSTLRLTILLMFKASHSEFFSSQLASLLSNEDKFMSTMNRLETSNRHDFPVHFLEPLLCSEKKTQCGSPNSQGNEICSSEGSHRFFLPSKSNDSEEQAMALHINHCAILIAYSRHVTSKLYLHHDELTRGGEEKQSNSFERDVANAISIFCKVLTNAVQVTLDEIKFNQSATFPIGIGLYESNFSYINHSCYPNACYRFSLAKNIHRDNTILSNFITNDVYKLPNHFHETWVPVITVRMLKDVKIGEEICVAYIDSIQPKLERQNYLKSKYHFSCQCDRCVENSSHNCDFFLDANILVSSKRKHNAFSLEFKSMLNESSLDSELNEKLENVCSLETGEERIRSLENGLICAFNWGKINEVQFFLAGHSFYSIKRKRKIGESESHGNENETIKSKHLVNEKLSSWKSLHPWHSLCLNAYLILSFLYRITSNACFVQPSVNLNHDELLIHSNGSQTKNSISTSSRSTTSHRFSKFLYSILVSSSTSSRSTSSNSSPSQHYHDSSLLVSSGYSLLYISALEYLLKNEHHYVLVLLGTLWLDISRTLLHSSILFTAFDMNDCQPRLTKRDTLELFSLISVDWEFYEVCELIKCIWVPPCKHSKILNSFPCPFSMEWNRLFLQHERGDVELGIDHRFVATEAECEGDRKYQHSCEKIIDNSDWFDSLDSPGFMHGPWNPNESDATFLRFVELSIWKKVENALNDYMDLIKASPNHPGSHLTGLTLDKEGKMENLRFFISLLACSIRALTLLNRVLDEDSLKIKESKMLIQRICLMINVISCDS